MARTKIKVGIATDRGRARRTAILDAAIAVVARDGTGAVTHRAVAKLAKVPLAATTYYFASRDDLLREAFRHLTARRMAAYDAAFATFAALPAGPGRDHAAAELERKLGEDVPVRPIDQPEAWYLAQPWLHGLVRHPLVGLRLELLCPDR